jgi:hypothetical protein
VALKSATIIDQQAHMSGGKYQRRLKDFDGSVKALAEAEGGP